MKNVILDMDPGVDDALAILLAFRSPELNVLGISIVDGNATPEQGVRNALNTIEILNLKTPPPVAKGLNRHSPYEALIPQHSIHGDDGLGNAHLLPPKIQPIKIPAVEFIIETVKANPGITIIPTGPLTNIAAALERAPEIFDLVEEIVFMGGAVTVPGNITPAAEFNFHFDPQSARTVVNSPARTTMVGLDVTRQATFHRATRDKYFGNNKKIPDYVMTITEHYMDFYQAYRGFDGCLLHDPLAIAVAADPTLVKTYFLHVDVETQGEITLGMTLADRREKPLMPPNCHVALEVDSERFMDMFINRLIK